MNPCDIADGKREERQRCSNAHLRDELRQTLLANVRADPDCVTAGGPRPHWDARIHEDP